MALNADSSGCSHVMHVCIDMYEQPTSQFEVSSHILLGAPSATTTQKSVDTLDYEGPRSNTLAPDASVENECSSSNLVDPASSHMLVSKIKPCMSKYKFCTAKL